MAVGGNATAIVTRAVKSKNKDGIAVAGKPEKLMELTGWLDYQAGQSGHLAYQAKLQDATHLWLCDYDEAYAALPEGGLSLVIDGKPYEVLLIEDPMGMHEHLETYLRYVG
ncbi:MAG: hypothetical protein RSN88_10840 [Gordonibacter sp.]|uniref:hypothetical protein n=1 Tax=Gordonibacter sp. TaxID=1968902 RepID=UPI002FC848AB